jgi:hypothetical protein
MEACASVGYLTRAHSSGAPSSGLVSLSLLARPEGLLDFSLARPEGPLDPDLPLTSARRTN